MKNREGVIVVLVLTRKRNQSIIIGNDIEVTVVEVRGDQVRLGIAAPRRVSVHRREVYDEIQAANVAAAATAVAPASAAVVAALRSLAKAEQ